jgi:hypothetical protein
MFLLSFGKGMDLVDSLLALQKLLYVNFLCASARY